MSKRFIKTLSVCILTLLMIISSIPIYSVAAAIYAPPGIFYEILEDGTAEISYCNDELTEITIPETIDGYTVTSLGSSAFSNSNIRTFSLPDTITHIADGAFDNCVFYNNESNWENDMLYVGKYLVFVKGESAGDVVIKDGTTLIADGAFQRYDEFNSLTIPASLENMGKQTDTVSFANGITVAADNKYYSSENGSLYNKDKTELLSYHIDLEADVCIIDLPDTVKHIDESAFPTGEFDELIIPASLEELTSQTLAPSEFKKITVHPDNKHLTIDENGFLYNKDFTQLIYHTAYSWYKEPIDYVAPESLKVISDYAFYSYQNLGTVTLPEGLEYIGTRAFAFSSRLSDVNIPSTVTYIGEDAFSYIEPYSTFFNENPNGVFYIDDCLVAARNYDDTELNVEDGTRLIANDVFSYSYKFTSVTLPDSLKIIGDRAFNGSYITNVELPEGLEQIGKEAFMYSDLESVTFSEGLKRIDDYAFYSVDVTSITLPESIEYMGEGVFESCISLTEISLPASLTKIPAYTFRLCGLTGELIIPDGVKEIGNGAFDICNLDGVVIPKSTEIIGYNAIWVRVGYIKGYKNTCAETYANENNMTFIPLDEETPSTSETTDPSTPTGGFDTGDVNKDGNINIKDATAIQKHIAMLITLDDEAMLLADYDADTKVTIKDTTAIQKMLAGLL